MVADAGFDGEAGRDGLAELAEDAVDFREIPQQSTAGFLSADDRCGAAEVEVDAFDGMLEKFFGGADEVVDVLADHLGKDRLAGGILVDRAEDPWVEPRVWVNAEILGDVDVGPAEARKDAQEGEVSHVLHRREVERGSVGWIELGQVD